MSLLVAQKQKYYTQKKQKIEYCIRKGNLSNHKKLKNLHKKVATISGGLVRLPGEITDEYINEVLQPH